MFVPPEEEQGNLSQLRLLLEELCCELCRFENTSPGAEPHEKTKVDREYYLGIPGTFADIRVAPEAAPPYCVEVKFGYTDEMLLRHIRRKYCERLPALADIEKIILVVDSEQRADWQRIEASLTASLAPGLALEVWNESRLVRLLNERFKTDIHSITPANLIDVRQSIDRAQGFYAFGGNSLLDYVYEPLHAELLWHFGFWKLRKLRESKRLGPREILPPDLYRGVAVIIADLCSFSSYVRDTPDTRIVRERLTSFYSKARYQIINSGGMLNQFVGDEVIGLFGIPEQSPHFARQTLETARALLSIGKSVAHNWQRQIDRLQPSSGVHVGIAIGDLQIVSFRPFGRTHVGAIGDCINLAARLMTAAGPGEVVVSNSFLQKLDVDSRAGFHEMAPVEGRNVGSIIGWKLSESF